MLIQLFAILTAQDVYFFDNLMECGNPGFQLNRAWIFIEIVIFYSMFVSSGLFVILANFLIRETGLEFFAKKDHRIDFLLKYQTLNSFFQTFFVMFSATLAAVLAQQAQLINTNQLPLHYIAQLAFAGVHFLQLVAMSIQVFQKSHTRNNKPKTILAIQFLFVFIVPVICVCAQAYLLYSEYA